MLFLKIKSLIIQILLKIKYRKKLCLESNHNIIRNINQVDISENGKICLSGLRLNENAFIRASSKGVLIIEKHVSMNRNVIIICKEKIIIKQGVSMGPNVCIYDHDHYFDAAGFQKSKFKTSPIIIGENTWIGAGCIILRGTTIGKNCIIGAGAIVKGNIPDNSIVKNTIATNIELLR